MRNKKLRLWSVISLFLFPVHAYALPIPEFTSAVFGLGEFFILLGTLLTLYFPFLRKNKSRQYGLYFLLVISLGVNIYQYFSPQLEQLNLYNATQANEDRPDMMMTQAQRDQDPYAIDEQEAFSLLKSQNFTYQGGERYLFIDARSRSETELGTAQGFFKLPWPDLAQLVSQKKLDMKGRTVIATCWTGMRGSEVCAKLRTLGIDCRYLKGGLKGWVEKKLPLLLSPGIDLSLFGTGQQFKDSEKLLSVNEAVQAKKEGVTIIDTRPHEKFMQSSIAGSINIDFDNIPTDEMEYQVRSLNTNKVLIACYGMISCSEAPGWGWEFNRLGYRYIGAYAGGIQAFNEHLNPSNLTTSSKYQIFKDKIINIFHQIFYFSNLMGLIFFSCVLGYILWITKKWSFEYFKERKQRMERKKQLTLNHDLNAIYKNMKKNLTKDLKSIFKSFIILVLAMWYGFLLSIVQASWQKIPIGPFHNLQSPTHFSLLNFIASFVMVTGLLGVLTRTFPFYFNMKNKKRYLFSGVFIYLVFLLNFSSISNICLFVLMASCIFMLMIDAIGWFYDGFKKHNTISRFNKGFLYLEEAWKMIPPHTKAYRLSQLSSNFNVPTGIVVRASHIEHVSNHVLKKLEKNFMVRSSALGEDGHQSSQAGLNLSIRGANEKNWIKQMRAVWLSYGKSMTPGCQEVLLLQKYVDPLFSGVMFSRHPSWGGVCVMEWGQGFSGKRMDGSENVHQIIMERVRGQVVFSNHETDYNFYPVFELLMKLENFYDIPLDIEWAIDKNHTLWLLQVRPQSALEHIDYPFYEEEKQTLLNDDFQTLNVCELSYSMENCTPLSASLLLSLWMENSSMDKACQMASWKFNDSQMSYSYALGRIWSSQSQLTTPDTINWYFAKKKFPNFYLEVEQSTHDFLRDFQMNLAMDWNLLKDKSWHLAWQKSLAIWQKMQTFAFYFELMAQVAVEECLKINPSKLHGIKIEDYLANGEHSFYAEEINYRCEKDYEISMPRFIELDDNKETVEFSKQLFGNVSKEILLDKLNKNVQEKIKLARKMIYLRDKHKHICLNQFYILRKAVLSIQSRLKLGQEVFEMTCEDINLLFSEQENKMVSQLKKHWVERHAIKNQVLPDSLDIMNFVMFMRPEKTTDVFKNDFTKKPIFVSNPQSVQGQILNIESSTTLAQLESLLVNHQENSIIIYSKFISPTWIHIAQKYSVKALVSKFGSTLSHPSILAREANMTFLINADLNIQNGTNITIDRQGNISY